MNLKKNIFKIDNWKNQSLDNFYRKIFKGIGENQNEMDCHDIHNAFAYICGAS